MLIKALAVGQSVALAALAIVGIAVAVLVSLWRWGADFAVTGAVIGACLALAVLAGLHLRRRLLALQRSAHRMELLAEMSVRVNREILLNEDIELIYRTILDYLFRIFDTATTGSVLILGPDGNLRYAASRGFTESFVNDFCLRLEDCFLYQVSGGEMKETRLISGEDFKNIETVFKPGDWEYKSVISAPIYLGDRLFGIFNLDSAISGTYNAEDVEIVKRFRSQIEVGLLARERYTENIQRYQVDALTGLLTRRYFEDLFKVALSRAIRHKEHFVIALFDVDGLKTVNDTYGHLAGDHMLLCIADAVRVSCRSSDMIGRFGGDEFIASYLMTDLPSMEKNIAAIRTKLRSKPILLLGNLERRLSFSYGLASFPEDGDSLESLEAVADQRLYAMKTASR